MLPDRTPITPDLACTFTHQKPYVSCKWLQAILERSSLSDPPAQMADFKPLVYTGLNPAGSHLQPVYNHHLLSGFAFTVPSHISLESPRLEAAVQLHGGMICSSSQRDTGDRSCVLIVTDMQREDLGCVLPKVTNLHITTVDHILEAMLRSDTSGMMIPVPKERLPKADHAVPNQSSRPASIKRKSFPGLTAPAAKRQHTQHVQAAGANAPVLSAQDNQAEASEAATEVHARRPASLHSSPDAHLQAAQPTDASSQDVAAGSDGPNDPPHAAQEADARPSSSTAPPQQPGGSSQGAIPDNNTVLWEPLVVRVQSPVSPRGDGQTGLTTTPNFKRFRKLQPRLAAHGTVPFSTKGYVENNIDSEAFLKLQKSKQQQQRVAEELFNANVRVQKQPAASKPVRGRGRGRGRAV
ncbi:hypothetical protein ABBQ38_000943 [Trebouxia sp. C0009 RCD-2024]